MGGPTRKVLRMPSPRWKRKQVLPSHGAASALRRPTPIDPVAGGVGAVLSGDDVDAHLLGGQLPGRQQMRRAGQGSRPVQGRRQRGASRPDTCTGGLVARPRAPQQQRASRDDGSWGAGPGRRKSGLETVSIRGRPRLTVGWDSPLAVRHSRDRSSRGGGGKGARAPAWHLDHHPNIPVCRDSFKTPRHVVSLALPPASSRRPSRRPPRIRRPRHSTITSTAWRGRRSGEGSCGDLLGDA
jgi:hypothetical protein